MSVVKKESDESAWYRYLAMQQSISFTKGNAKLSFSSSRYQHYKHRDIIDMCGSILRMAESLNPEWDVRARRTDNDGISRYGPISGYIRLKQQTR